jgi:hypothetical protein
VIESHVTRAEFCFAAGLAAIFEYIKIGEQKKKGRNVENSETIKQFSSGCIF